MKQTPCTALNAQLLREWQCAQLTLSWGALPGPRSWWRLWTRSRGFFCAACSTPSASRSRIQESSPISVGEPKLPCIRTHIQIFKSSRLLLYWHTKSSCLTIVQAMAKGTLSDQKSLLSPRHDWKETREWHECRPLFAPASWLGSSYRGPRQSAPAPAGCLRHL